VPSRFRWLKALVSKNWGLKLLAVLLAGLTYYAIRGATGFEVSYDIPLEVKVEKGIAILDQDTRTVEVTFRGSQEDIRRLDQKQIKVVMWPRASDPAGSEKVSVRSRNVEGAPGVRVVKIRPGSVTLTFDHETEKNVPVAKPKTVGVPLIGKVEIDYEPRSVSIRGPTRRLKDKNIVFTEPVDVEGRVESFSKRVRVLSPGDTWAEIEPAEVSVSVNIVRESVSREWTNVAVVAVIEPGSAADVSFEPAVVNVSLHGRPKVLESVSGDSVMVFVDCVGLDPSASYELPVNVHLPTGVDVNTGVEPESVRVVFGWRARKID